MTQSPQSVARKRLLLLARPVLIALALNVVAWIGAAMLPDGFGGWGLVSLSGCIILGFTIGQWWALLVILAYGVIHAIPVSLGFLPGYLSTWGEALWWLFALILMLILTALGVLGRRLVRWLRRRGSAWAAEAADRS